MICHYHSHPKYLFSINKKFQKNVLQYHPFHHFLTKKQQKYFCIQNELLWCLLLIIVSVWDCSEAWDCGTCLITLVNNDDNTISLVCWPMCKFCDYRDNEFARDTLIRKYDTSLNMTSLTDMIKSHQILLNRTYWINISDVSSTM